MSINDLDRDHLRRELRAVDDLQRETLPSFRSALRRVFGDDDGSAEREQAQSALALGGLTRRNALRIGGITVLGGAVLAACGSSGSSGSTTSASSAATTMPEPSSTAASTTTMAPTTTVAPSTTTAAAAAMPMDVVILRTASSIEELAIAAYQTAIDSGLVKTAAIADAAKLFQEQHREHAKLFRAQTEAAGGQAFTMPNPAILAAIKPTIDALKDEMGVVALAFDLETVAAQTYQANVGTFTDIKLNQTIMSVGGVEARHAAVLAGVLKQMQVPAAFQRTDKATPPGTGV